MLYHYINLAFYTKYQKRVVGTKLHVDIFNTK